MRQLFSFFGSKHNQARAYPHPSFGTIVEPFAGAAGYSHHWPDKRVILVEKDPEIAELWRYLIGATREDILRLPLIEPGQKVRDLWLSPGQAALIGFWCNISTTSPRQSLSKRAIQMLEAGRAGAWGARLRAQIADAIHLVDHWQVIEGDYTSAPDIEATWFIDPPYADKGRYYRCGTKDIDYAALGEWCRSRKGQVIVCEQEGADWLPFKPHKSHRTSRKGKRSAEVVWLDEKRE